MRVVRAESDDPVVVGYCTACDQPIFSNEDYYIDQYGAMIHAKGVGATAKIAGSDTSIYISCLHLYLQQEHPEYETAEIFGLEKKEA